MWVVIVSGMCEREVVSGVWKGRVVSGDGCGS